MKYLKTKNSSMMSVFTLEILYLLKVSDYGPDLDWNIYFLLKKIKTSLPITSLFTKKKKRQLQTEEYIFGPAEL